MNGTRGGVYPKEACGLFGLYGHAEAAQLTYLGLYALQHRGEESAGIVSTDGTQLYSHKGMGLVGDVFNEERLAGLPGRAAIGHVRYSTTGSSHLQNAQPLLDTTPRSSLAVAHNGNLINAGSLRRELEGQGVAFHTSVDSEMILHLFGALKRPVRDAELLQPLRKLAGAFSLLLLTEEQLVAVRDPQGFRPLCLGQLDGAWVVSSETCALDLINAKFVRDIEPGEVVAIGPQGLRTVGSLRTAAAQPTAHCIFEYVYFARPDSKIDGRNVEEVRYQLGRLLAKEHPAQADLVMPVPDSGNFAALGYSHESKIPFAWGMVRNHYIGRTFIQPSQPIRDFKVRVKLNPLASVLRGKRIIVVDDSIVRGTTSRLRIHSLREAGAVAVHMRISCPPTSHPCYYGIDFPTEEELIASRRTVEEIRAFLGADSLGYLSLEGLLTAVGGTRQQFCTACYSGDYPLQPTEEVDKFALERFHGDAVDLRDSGHSPRHR